MQDFLNKKEKINPVRDLSSNKVNFKEIIFFPNLVSLFRILAAFVIFVAAFLHAIHLWVAILYLVAIASDKIDGVLARLLKKETKLGLILEPIADSLLAYAVVTYLYFNLTFPNWVLYIALILLVFGLLANLFFYLKRRSWYIPKLLSSKPALFTLYLAGGSYFFNLPYKIFFVYLAMIFGLFAYFDYLWKLAREKTAIFTN